MNGRCFVWLRTWRTRWSERAYSALQKPHWYIPVGGSVVADIAAEAHELEQVEDVQDANKLLKLYFCRFWH